MAVFAGIGCIDVSGILARYCLTVMTTRAIAGDGGVIKVGWRPAIGGMTVIAVIAAGNMSRVFAGRNRVVVAT